MFQEPGGSLRLLCLQERNPDPGEAGRWVPGGSTICPLLLPEGPVGPWLTPSRGSANYIPSLLAIPISDINRIHIKQEQQMPEIFCPVGSIRINV